MTHPAAHRPALLQPNAKEPPAIRCAPPTGGDGQVLDANTFDTIEVDKLFDSVNHAHTLTGQAALYRDLSHPLADAGAILARQEAIQAIEGSRALRDSLEALVVAAKKDEKDFYDLLYGTFMGMVSAPANPLEIEGYGYTTYIKGTRFLVNLVENTGRLPATGSTYLQSVLGDLKAFGDSRPFALAKGPAYRSEKGMITAAEKKWYTPAIRFEPSLFKPMFLFGAFLAFAVAAMVVPLVLDLFGSISPVAWLFIMPLALLYIPIVGGFDRDGCIYPIRDVLRKAPEVETALQALGSLDELLGFIRFREHFRHSMVLPGIAAADRHTLIFKGVRNPILAKEDPAYVGNDVDLDQGRLILITGPNSGGKTAFCKTVAQTQLLAQIGCYVAAESADVAVADHIFYQVPEISHLNDGEGRFGTELRHTKNIFLAATPRSLVIMDELSEGTTHEEKIEISKAILEGFHQKGNSTLLITHNHELVDALLADGLGLARQVEFRNDQPTYRLVEGISRVSHAERVAKKIGFSREDIARYLGGQA